MSSNDSEGSRKKDKGIYVPSRHKQAAEGISRLCLYSKRNTRDETSLETRVLSSTAVQDQVALPSIDASAITSANSSATNKKKQSEISTLTVPKDEESSTLFTGAKSKVKQKRKPSQSEKNIEKEAELLYIEYLQAKYLESKAKKSLEIRSKKALEKIQELYCLMEDLLVKNGSVKRDLEFVDYLINFNEHLKRQERFLLPNLDMVASLEKKYEEISTNVNFVQHELGIVNIKLPEPGNEGKIVELVEKIEALLCSIMSYIQNCEEIILNAEAADMLNKQGKVATEELERGYQLVEEVTDLLLTETSMKLAC